MAVLAPMSLHVVLCRRASFSVKARAVASTGVLQVRTEQQLQLTDVVTRGDMQLQSELEVSEVNGLSSMD